MTFKWDDIRLEPFETACLPKGTWKNHLPQQIMYSTVIRALWRFFLQCLVWVLHLGTR